MSSCATVCHQLRIQACRVGNKERGHSLPLLGLLVWARTRADRFTCVSFTLVTSVRSGRASPRLCHKLSEYDLAWG
jgi:hypothetical protein